MESHAPTSTLASHAAWLAPAGASAETPPVTREAAAAQLRARLLRLIVARETARPAAPVEPVPGR